MKEFPISLSTFEKSRKSISSWVNFTPIDFSRTLSERSGTSVYLKMENNQITGSFKIRGALNKVLSLSPEERKKGLITCSAGNHAQGLAYAAQCVKASALIVVPRKTSLVKQQAVLNYGAELVTHGQIYDESYEHAIKLCEETSRVFVHAYKDPMVISGQGSVGLEILEQISDLDSVIVPIGGGGLMSGMACVIKQIKPSCRVYGVVSETAPGMEKLFHKKEYQPEKDFSIPVLTDGISVKKPNQYIFETYLSRYVDDVVAVSEDETSEAIVVLLERAKTLVEGSGAVVVAALLKQKSQWNFGKKCALILSGGNIDLNIISYVIEKGLKASGRLGRLSLVVKDEPGALNHITSILSSLHSNILSIHHERNNPSLSHGLVQVDIVVETKSNEHLQKIRLSLKNLSVTKKPPS